MKMLCECQTVLYLYLCFGKRYFILEQQIARHFVQYSGCLYASPFMQLKKCTFFILRISANHDKGKFSKLGHLMPPR